MKIRFAQTFVTASVLLLATSAFAAKDYVILEIGDKQIKKSEVEVIWSSLFPGGETPDFDTVEEPIKQNVLRGVISEYLLYDEAVKAGIDKSPELQARLKELKRKLAVRAFIEQKSGSMVTDKEIRKKYDELVKKMRGKEEVRARHILVKTEDEARAIKKALDDDGNFEVLAKEKSNDPGSKVQGGDLGYFTEERMVPEFSKAAFALKEGEISDPVKSSFGWHIIKLEDRRKVKVPTYSDMKDEIKAKLNEERLNDFVSKLVDSTNVKYYGSNGKEKELTRMPSPKDK